MKVHKNKEGVERQKESRSPQVSIPERLSVTFGFTCFFYSFLFCVMPFLILGLGPWVDLTFMDHMFTAWGFLGSMVVIGLWTRHDWTGE